MDLQHMENDLGGGGGGGATNNIGSLSEIDFQRLAQTIASSIQKILQNVSTMQRMVNQCNTLQDSPDLKKQLHQILTYTHQLVSDTNGHLKELDKCKDRHMKIQRDRLIDDFTAALTSFKAVLSKRVDIEKTQVRQARANHYSIPKPPGSSSNTTKNGNNSFFDDNIFNKKSQQQTQMQEEIDLEALEEQEKAIRELEENIVGVNEIYKKLGAMVYEQGLAVDSIESSVENTSVFVSQGTENLRKASSYKNKMRKKKLILFGIVFMVAVVLMIVLITQLKN